MKRSKELVKEYYLVLRQRLLLLQTPIATIMAEGKMREGWVNLLVLPPQLQSTEEEEKMAANKKLLERLERLDNLNGNFLTPTSKVLTSPLSLKSTCCVVRDRCMKILELEAARAALREQGFDFAQRYPGIHACTTKEACSGMLNNVWTRTAPAPPASLLEAFSTVEEALQAYLAGKKGGKKRPVAVLWRSCFKQG